MVGFCMVVNMYGSIFSERKISIAVSEVMMFSTIFSISVLVLQLPQL